MNSLLDRIFRLREAHTTVRTELLAGLTTFMTISYIMIINPAIMSDAGMDKTAVLIATCIASFAGSMVMAFLANLPCVLSVGMGLNAFFVYTVVLTMGCPWQLALLAVLTEGLLFIFLTVTNIREKVYDVIPLEIKKAVPVGIGLFIALIGLQKAGICVDNSATLVSINNFKMQFEQGNIAPALSVFGVVITFILYAKKIRGSILIGILATWAVGIICQYLGFYSPDLNHTDSLYPNFGITDFEAADKLLFKCFDIDFSSFNIINFAIIVFSFLFVDFFGSLGTLVGVCTSANMVDEYGRFDKIKPALLADATATTLGAMVGTSTVTTMVESATGASIGGRTGLTALTGGLLFLVCVLFAPVFISIPTFATAPALVVVGGLMFSNIVWNKCSEDMIPSYLCIIAMPFFYSIAEGITWGILSYVVLKIFKGEGRKIKPLLYLIALILLSKYFFI